MSTGPPSGAIDAREKLLEYLIDGISDTLGFAHGTGKFRRMFARGETDTVRRLKVAVRVHQYRQH